MFPKLPTEWRDMASNMTLEDLNDMLVGLHIMTIVFIAVLMVVGVVGNILSIYVFTTTYESSTHRYFILWMAWIDLVACAVGKPLLLVSMIKPYMFPSESLCKIGRFLHVNFVVTSALIVVAIASERHRRICSPFSLELSSKRTLIICVLATVFGSLTAIPAVLVYGDANVETGIENMTGIECFVVPGFDATIYPELYFLFQLVLTFICITVLTFFYSRTGITLWIHVNFRKQNTYSHQRVNKVVNDKPKEGNDKIAMDNLKVENDVCHSISTRSDYMIITTPKDLVLTKPYVEVQETDNNVEQSEDVERHASNDVNNVPKKVYVEIPETDITGVTDDMERHASNDVNNVPKKVRIQIPETVPEGEVIDTDGVTINVPKIETEAHVTNKEGVVVTKPNNPGHRLKRASTIKHRIESSDDDRSENEGQGSLATKQVTMMFFLITLVFVISFIPHLIVLLTIVIRKEILDDMSPVSIVFYTLFLRSFVINNMANPIIYAFCDCRFRNECKTAVMNVLTCGRYYE